MVVGRMLLLWWQMREERLEFRWLQRSSGDPLPHQATSQAPGCDAPPFLSSLLLPLFCTAGVVRRFLAGRCPCLVPGTAPSGALPSIDMSVSEDYLQTLTAAQLVEKLVSPQSAEEDVDLMLDWFLFTYSPEQAWDTVQASAEALKDPRLHKLIVTKVKDNYQPEIFLEAVNVVASLRTLLRHLTLMRMKEFYFYITFRVRVVGVVFGPLLIFLPLSSFTPPSRQ